MRTVDKQRTHVARVLHGAGVDRLNDLFGYNTAALELYSRPRHGKATAEARKRRAIVRASRRANRP